MTARMFRNVRLGETQADVWFDGTRIARVGSAGSLPSPDCEVAEGGWLTPPLAEPHVHLDAALLGAVRPNRSGTLREGIANWAELREALTADDLRRRALETAEMYASWGALRIRTHVDTGSPLAVEVLVSLKGELAQRGIELQVVAFPQEGILRAPGRRQAWEAAVAMGCDAVGAIPHFERTTEEGWRSVHLAFELAEKHGKMLDFHCDETDDPASRNLEVVCAETLDRGLAGKVVAGHCTAMHGYPNPHAAKVCELVASSGVQVVCNPLDNVVLQGRYDGYPRRRGLTRVDELWRAGATVGIGHDSVQDPWYRLGTANLLDAAYMLVHVGHLTGEEDMHRVFRTLFSDNHLAFGGAPRLAEGYSGAMLWWPSSDPVELIRDRPRPTVIGRPSA
jgi:cytosine deaminase